MDDLASGDNPTVHCFDLILNYQEDLNLAEAMFKHFTFPEKIKPSQFMKMVYGEPRKAKFIMGAPKLRRKFLQHCCFELTSQACPKKAKSVIRFEDKEDEEINAGFDFILKNGKEFLWPIPLTAKYYNTWILKLLKKLWDFLRPAVWARVALMGDFLDDATLTALNIKTVKAFLDVGVCESMCWARWGATKWVQNEPRAVADNTYDPNVEMPVEEVSFEKYASKTHIDAVFKRACFLVNSKAHMYYRVAGINEEKAKRISLHSNDKYLTEDGFVSAKLVNETLAAAILANSSWVIWNQWTWSFKDMGAFVNAFALAVWIYVAANISGGHLNPAVSFSTCVCGFYPLLHTIIYVILQICGAICGAWALSGLVPGASAGMGDGGPGCFDSTVISSELTGKQVFWWECLMTFTLISCVYACGVAKPGHGSHTPLAVGLSLFACAASGGQYTGGALNPARVLGPFVVFDCGEDWAGLYVGAQALAAVFAMSVFAFVSGLGPLNPRMSKNALGLSWPEAMFLWITGSPPSRMQVTGKEPEGVSGAQAFEEMCNWDK
ncbi:unnamed protein product [Effrenium voratum]|nr:unnamed protein product [Effrenium voratum]